MSMKKLKNYLINALTIAGVVAAITVLLKFLKQDTYEDFSKKKSEEV